MNKVFIYITKPDDKWGYSFHHSLIPGNDCSVRYLTEHTTKKNRVVSRGPRNGFSCGYLTQLIGYAV